MSKRGDERLEARPQGVEETSKETEAEHELESYQSSERSRQIEGVLGTLERIKWC